MDSASLQFVFFGLAAAMVSNFNRSRAWRSTVLVLASAAFFLLLHPGLRSILPLLGFLLVGYVTLFLVEHGWKKYVGWGVAVVIVTYIWLKKYTFLPEASFLHFYYFTLGLSYIFFRVLHLIIEAGDENCRERVGLGAYLLYLVNFTTFVSGPIQRYNEFARDQFAAEPEPLDARIVGLQLERVVRGFFKVNVLAILLNDLRLTALEHLSQPQPVAAKALAIFQIAFIYPLFLYCNFSGYIDIVIAIARLMRLRLPENFDRPFAAASFIDFWNRWHITLSTWLKTYVYYPLLMVLMRRVTASALEPLLGVLSFFVTFFLVGLWHGRTSEFLFFGLLQGGGVAVNKLWQILMTRALSRKGYRELSKKSLYVAFSRGLTFTWFAFTLFWFWAGWAQINALFSAVAPWYCTAVFLFLWVAATLALAGWEGARTMLLSLKTAEGPVLTSRYALVVYASAMGLASLVLTILLNQPAPQLVYKAF